jgi:hypothetical protein
VMHGVYHLHRARVTESTRHARRKPTGPESSKHVRRVSRRRNAPSWRVGAGGLRFAHPSYELLGKKPGDGGAQASIRRHRAEHRAGRSSRRHSGGSALSRLVGLVAKSRESRRARNQSIDVEWIRLVRLATFPVLRLWSPDGASNDFPGSRFLRNTAYGRLKSLIRKKHGRPSTAQEPEYRAPFILAA